MRGKNINKKVMLNVSLSVLGVFVLGLFFLEPYLSKIENNVVKVKNFVEEHDIKPRGGIADALSAAVTAVKYKTESYKIDEEITVPIRGNLNVEVIDRQTICLVGDYYDFLKERFLEECGDFLMGIESETANVPAWSKVLFYNESMAEIILKYRPAIAAAYNDGEHFTLSNGIEILRTGYWVNPIGQFVVPNVKKGEDLLTKNAQVVHFAYLRLMSPLKDDTEYVLRNPLGENVVFHYKEKENISGAIKVNQVGYSPEAGKKYAYVGAWLGTLGPLDFSYLKKAIYTIHRAETGEAVYRGFLTKRMDDPLYNDTTFFTGEDVYQIDFSAFHEEGNYYIHVPGVGISYTFEIGENAIGEAFYTHAKGLYHKRCGIAKESPYTEWHLGECHMKTYRSNFPPNDRHYSANDDRGCGFFDENGKSVAVSHFTLIDAIQTDEVVEGVRGGWHDAADYDRRPYHYNAVNGLLTAYLMHPDNFTDGQLNIPESGNGIPDILDEALWGMEVWRNAQLETGAVGGWIEATSHPWEWNPGLDDQKYYLSAATRESSLQYSAYAGMMSLALKKAEKQDLSDLYLKSAIAAYEFGMNPSNRFIATYMYPVEDVVDGIVVEKKVPYTYKESTEMPIAYVFKAGFNLFTLTSDKKYLDPIKAKEDEVVYILKNIHWNLTPLFFSEFIMYGGGIEPWLDEKHNYYKERVVVLAKERLEMLENSYPYRIPWYPAYDGYVSHMSWGSFHPLRNAEFFIAAFEFTKEKIYRDAVFLCNDWHNGANPFGQTLTSGLGKNYPVKFLDLASASDGIAEYVLGISPYRNTFGIPKYDKKLAHALFYDFRKDRKFRPEPKHLFSESALGTNFLSEDDFSQKLGSMWPIWRRFGNVQSYTVAASEYTVNETICPAATATAWLLSTPWKPNETIKNRKPATDIKTLKGYGTLP